MSSNNADEREGKPLFKLHRNRMKPTAPPPPPADRDMHEGFNPPPQGKKTVFPDDDNSRGSVSHGSTSEGPEARIWKPSESWSSRNGGTNSRRDEGLDRKPPVRTYADRPRPGNNGSAVSSRSSVGPTERGRSSGPSRRERERSQSQEHHPPHRERYHGHSATGSSAPEKPPNYQEKNMKRRRIDEEEEKDELDTLSDYPKDRSQPRSAKHQTTSPELEIGRSGSTKEQSSGFLSFSFGKALKSIVGLGTPGPPEAPPSLFSATFDKEVATETSPMDPEALQTTLETLAQSQAELKHCESQLDALRQQCAAQVAQINKMQTAGSDLTQQVLDLREQLEEAKQQAAHLEGERNQALTRLKQAEAHAEQPSNSSKQLTLDRAEAHIATLEERIKGLERYHAKLATEKGQLASQLKQMRQTNNGRPPPETFSTDLFDNTLDQVSEASIKSAVESLNDSITNLVMSLLDAADEFPLVERDPVRGVPRGRLDEPLLMALSAHCRHQEKRGFILEALCHDYTIGLFNVLFFAGEAVPHFGRKELLLESVLAEMTASGAQLFTHDRPSLMLNTEPWPVAQRWRSLTAQSVSRMWQNDQKNDYMDNLFTFFQNTFTWAYEQPAATFCSKEFLKLLEPLRTIYTDAARLAITVRKDVLSVRMSVSTYTREADGEFPRFDSRGMEAMWPEMDVSENDPVLGMYHLGLERVTRDGDRSLMVRPKVTTGALLRYCAN
ncbi:hypothetical protein HMN09_01204000 [Mycena chlorophos]|uniref:Uncharacterized protein n=1 Tax=Mycena chlorophos TaxID=658473 RepID=A0A8H6S5K9_MYCCL|nr:hypothetical protein HMN09_01204000 [Mycena chlorophos]